MPILALLALLAAGLAAWFLARRRRTTRRRALFLTPLAPEYDASLERNVRLYRALPGELRRELQGHIQVFLDEKIFEGCGGLVVTDEIRLTIAAQACMLLLNRSTDYFPGFRTILVYPDTFVVPIAHTDGLLETSEVQAREGESWHGGPVVLSWADVVHDAGGQRDGCNVVLHEFAHKLDEENVVMDGLPMLDADSRYASWAEVLEREYHLLRADAESGEAPVLDEYGASSPAEFFAVATESFFESPVELERGHPLLYAELAKFYKVDPARWPAH